MKNYEIDYIIGYLKDKLNYDVIGIVCMGDKIIIDYKFKEIILEVEINERFIVNNDIIQISRICRRKINDKVLNIINKE